MEKGDILVVFLAVAIVLNYELAKLKAWDDYNIKFSGQPRVRGLQHIHTQRKLWSCRGHPSY